MSRGKKASAKNVSDIAARLDILARENKITLYRLAKILGVTHSYFSDLKKGRIAQGGIKFWDAIRREYPQWENYLRNTAQYPPTREKTTKRSNETQNNLIRLCILARIEITPGVTWEEKLAQWLKVDESEIVTAIEADYLSDRLINTAAAMGYASEQWLDKKNQPNNVELSFKKLAMLLKIPMNHDWLYQLAKSIKCDISDIPLAILKNKVPEALLDLIEERGYPLDAWWVSETPGSTQSPFVDLQIHDEKMRLAEKILCSETKYANLLIEYLDHLAHIMKMGKKEK